MCAVESQAPQSVQIKKTWATAISSLDRERQEIIQQANERLAEIQEAIGELATIYAEKLALPKGWQYRFEGTEDDLKMTAVPPEAPDIPEEANG